MKKITLPRFNEVKSNTPDGDSHTINWVEWGASDNPHVIICAHGLSRNARDFDFLARRLSQYYRLICPDYPGRGMSQRLAAPEYYTMEQYVRDSRALISVIEFDQLDWIGTSMGGLIGMSLAALDHPLISKLVINDIGPFITKQALANLATELVNHPTFGSMEDALAYFRAAYVGFGSLNDTHYAHMCQHGVWPCPDKAGYVLARDPNIIDNFVSMETADIELWEIWNTIKIPVLIIRGEDSDLLSLQTVEKMQHTHPLASSVQIPECGHAPSLMVDDQIDLIKTWLQK